MKRPLAVMMTREIKTIDPNASLYDAAKIMRDKRVGALFVEEAGNYIGVISETDLVRRGMAEDKNLRLEKVRAIMSSPIISIDIDRPASDASDLMSEKGTRHLAVTDSGKIVGLISVRDLLRYFKNWGAF
ncbi:MAG TPA: CBS domain-containing protein [Nitrospiria bacterium]|nr:CBS domain-containing protein [Nitrospiria bacterium]HLB94882.1 CBS domain-containing protein [Nitrospiria bacterium]